MKNTFIILLVALASFEIICMSRIKLPKITNENSFGDTIVDLKALSIDTLREMIDQVNNFELIKQQNKEKHRQEMEKKTKLKQEKEMRIKQKVQKFLGAGTSVLMDFFVNRI
jgi:hypothetical protein